MSVDFIGPKDDVEDIDPKFKNTIEFETLSDAERQEVVFTRMRLPTHDFEADIRFLTFLIANEIEWNQKAIVNGFSGSIIKENNVKTLAEESCNRIFKRISGFYLNGILLIYFSREGLTNFIIEEITSKLVDISTNHNVTNNSKFSANAVVGGKSSPLV